MTRRLENIVILEYRKEPSEQPEFRIQKSTCFRKIFVCVILCVGGRVVSEFFSKFLEQKELNQNATYHAQVSFATAASAD